MPSLAMSWASLQGGNPITTLAKKIYSVHSDFKPCFSHVQELRLSSDYLFLLRAQSSFDLVSAERITSKNISKNERHRQRSFFSLLQLYLITSTPITAFPYVFPDFSKRIELFVLPWIFPFVQVTAFEKQEGSLSWPGAIFFQYCIYNLSITLILFVHSDLYYPHINVHFTILIPGFRSSRPLWPPQQPQRSNPTSVFWNQWPKEPIGPKFQGVFVSQFRNLSEPSFPKTPHFFLPLHDPR